MELKLIQNKIFEVRGLRVMLDFDLAEMYEVKTKVLKQAVKRNINRFPSDFMFELTKVELEEVVTICDHLRFLRGGESEHEVAGETVAVALHRLVECLGRNAVDRSKIEI